MVGEKLLVLALKYVTFVVCILLFFNGNSALDRLPLKDIPHENYGNQNPSGSLDIPSQIKKPAEASSICLKSTPEDGMELG